jgi:hypothetical protein
MITKFFSPIVGLFAACIIVGPDQIRAADSRPAFPEVKDLPLRKEMPDPLLMNDGTKVTDAAQWKARREEIKRTLEYYSIGSMPPAPGNVKGQDVKSQAVNDGKANFRLVHLTFGPEEKLGLDIAVFTPAQSAGPFPTFVYISFDTTPGTTAAPAAGGGRRGGRRGGAETGGADPDQAARGFATQLERGYAVVTFGYTQSGLDSRAASASNKVKQAYPDYDMGLEGTWAWSMSRVVDYLQTQPFADKTKIVAIGISRLGKATLIAGAFDERFALVAPAGSGAFGTGAFRFNGTTNGGKQGLDEFTKTYDYQVGPRLTNFYGQVYKLPFDQHWLIALVAPRPFISLEGLDDQYCNGNALKQSWLAAKPVFDLLGATDRLGVNFRPGAHMLSPLDWQAALDFSDRHLRGMDVKRVFNEFPPQEQLH